jgi:hypothetical protein
MELIGVLQYSIGLMLILGIPILFILQARRDENLAKSYYARIAREFNSSIVESFGTVFYAKEYTFQYGKYQIKFSSGNPYTDRSMALSYFDYRTGGKYGPPRINIYINDSSQQDLKVNIYNINGYAQKVSPVEEVSKKYKLTEDIASAILDLKSGDFYIRKRFIMHAIPLERRKGIKGFLLQTYDMPDKDFMKNNVEKLIALTEKLEKF